MKRLGLVLLSGGLDSTTVAALACRQGQQLTALTVNYGQAHDREIGAARRVASALGIAHQIVDVSFYRDLAWHSALTHPQRFSIPAERSPEAMGADIPVTYVPLRNTFFLTLGAAWLESEVLEAIETQRVRPEAIQATLFIAANAIDYSGYPDCRPEYYESVTQALRMGSKMGTQYGIGFQIETPLIDKSKADIVRLAIRLGAPLEHTWSCYKGGERPCGSCDSCLLRAKGFEEAGLPDPALAVI